MKGKLPKRIFEILEATGKEDRAARVFVIAIITLIILNVISVALETEKGLYLDYRDWFRYFEIFSVVVFTIEYLLRVWTCAAEERYKQPVMGRIRFIFTPLALVDLAAILPFYLPLALPLAGPLDLRFLRIIRLVRLVRIFKIGRYSEAIKTLAAVLRAKKNDLAVTLIVVFVLLIVAASLMYYAENESQPQVFSSIPATMWAVSLSLANLGGNIAPATTAGKAIGVFIWFLGLGLFALPAGILASGFVEELQKKRAPKTCPHCGKPIN